MAFLFQNHGQNRGFERKKPYIYYTRKPFFSATLWNYHNGDFNPIIIILQTTILKKIVYKMPEYKF